MTLPAHAPRLCAAPLVQLLSNLTSLWWWQAGLIGDLLSSAGSSWKPKATAHPGAVVQHLHSVGFLLLFIPRAPQGLPLLQHALPIGLHGRLRHALCAPAATLAPLAAKASWKYWRRPSGTRFSTAFWREVGAMRRRRVKTLLRPVCVEHSCASSSTSQNKHWGFLWFTLALPPVSLSAKTHGSPLWP